MKFTAKQIQEMKTLKKVYMVRLALSETLTEKATEIEQKILNSNSFKDEDGKIVKDPRETFLIDQKSGDFDKFHQLRKIEMRKAGLGHPQDEDGFAVDAVASYKVVEIKKRIFEYVLKTLPKQQKEIFEKSPFKIINGKSVFDTVIDLFLRMEIN